jgi:large subunit ribosomal protein L21
MYAVIRTGGKQYKVRAGDIVQVEKLEQELGAEFDINEILLVGGDATLVGQPLVKGAKVTVVVTKQAKTRKIIVFKKKRRKGYRKLNTHKQDFTELFVKTITSPDGKVAKAETTPVVKDMAVIRQQKIADKVSARIERAENRNLGETVLEEAKKVVKNTAAKKTVKKTVKKAGVAKKKVTKKTTKKA